MLFILGVTLGFLCCYNIILLPGLTSVSARIGYALVNNNPRNLVVWNKVVVTPICSMQIDRKALLIAFLQKTSWWRLCHHTLNMGSPHPGGGLSSSPSLELTYLIPPSNSLDRNRHMAKLHSKAHIVNPFSGFYFLTIRTKQGTADNVCLSICLVSICVLERFLLTIVRRRGWTSLWWEVEHRMDVRRPVS